MANKWVPCVCNRVRIDLSGSVEQIDDMLSALPSKYRDMAPATIEKDEAGWVYVEPGNMCQAETRSTFAPGHDARMAGLIGWAEAVGAQVSYTDGGVLRSGEPLTMLEDFGSTALREKAIIIADNISGKGKKVRDKKAPVRKARIKVGRHEYDATIDTATGEATYVSKGSGQTTTVGEGTYTLLDDTVVAQ